MNTSFYFVYYFNCDLFTDTVHVQVYESMRSVDATKNKTGYERERCDKTFIMD